MKNNPFLFLLLLLIAACTPSNQQSDINTDTIEADISETPEQNDTHLTSQEENNSPKTESLSDRLWAFVDGCYGAIYDEEYEDNGFSERVDDAKNGYVHISGSWPTCGCSCSSTAGAYKNEKGEYILLKNEHWGCSFTHILESDKDIRTILPDNFDLSVFGGEATELLILPETGRFILTAEIPRKGTVTTFSLGLTPIGFNPTCAGGICFNVNEETGNASYWQYTLPELAKGISSNEALSLIAEGNYDALSEEDHAFIQNYLSDQSGEVSIEELTEIISELFYTHQFIQKAAHKSLTMDWDRKTGKFYIIEKGTPFKKSAFKDFIINGYYYQMVC